MALSKEEVLAQKAMSGGITGNIIVVLGAVTGMILGSLLGGAVVFVVVAAIVGFISWLAGAASPRDVALTVGGAIGCICAIIEVILRFIRWGQAVKENLDRQRIRAIEEES